MSDLKIHFEGSSQYTYNAVDFIELEFDRMNIQSRLDEAIKNTKLENWGAWLDVKTRITFDSEYDYKAFAREYEYIFEVDGNTKKPIYGNNVGAQVSFSRFNDENYNMFYHVNFVFFIVSDQFKKHYNY